MELIWIKGEPPNDKEGRYLVWIEDLYIRDKIHFYKVMKVSNGFLEIIDGSFKSDYMGKETKITAHIPLELDPPNFTK